MKIYDVSVTVTSQLPTWPSDPKVILERASKIEEGADANVSRLDMGVHTGTHIDAPFHFFPAGITVERLPLDILIGQAWVVEVPDYVTTITADVLKKAALPTDCQRILFKTSNSQISTLYEKVFHKDYVGLSEDGAEYLVARGVRLVGIDYLSIAPFDQTHPTHVTLLKANVIIIEGLDLSKVNPGRYQLFCLPVKLGGADGAPARVVLLED